MKGKGKCCKESRKEKITKLLAGAYFQSQSERNESVNIYNKSTLSVAEIENLVRPLVEMTDNISKHHHKMQRKVMGIGGVY